MVKAVFFDFYGTLVHFGSYHLEATAAFLDMLGLDEEPGDFFDHWNEHFYALKDHLVEHDEFLPIWHMYGESMDRAFRERGHDLTGNQISACVAVCTHALPEFLTPAPGVEAAVDDLAGDGFRLAVVSNADEHDLLNQLKMFELDDRFEVVLSSEHAQAYKPHPRIFEMALKRMDLGAGEVAFVGDNPRWDIAGANRVGMTSVWYNRDGAEAVEGIEPDFVVRKLGEVGDVVGGA